MSRLRNLDKWATNTLDDLRRLEVTQDLEDRFSPYRDHPVPFVREQLGAEPEPYQVEILEACPEEDRIAWQAAHGVGKTTTLSWILLWWLLSRPFSRVLILAPAFERQIGRYLLPELRRWSRNAPEPLPVVVRANTVEVLGFAREWFAIGVQASDSSKVEGGHAESLCVLADEAKGLDAEVVAALHGTQTDVGGDRLYFLASVPGGPAGPFYDATRSRAWRSFHTSAEDSARVSDQWIEERAEEWGRGSPLFIARVLGEFPAEDDGTLFAMALIEAAIERELEYEEDPAVVLGVDPARYGPDGTAIARWEGKRLVGVERRHGLDTMETASWVASQINQLSPSGVAVDAIGIGAGVVDRLKQLGHKVADVNVGQSAHDPQLFARRRSEIFWRFREALERGEVSLPDDDRLVAELSAFRYDFSASGQVTLESKDETKKRIGRSPDLADAVVLAYSLIDERAAWKAPSVSPRGIPKSTPGWRQMAAIR